MRVIRITCLPAGRFVAKRSCKQKKKEIRQVSDLSYYKPGKQFETGCLF